MADVEFEQLFARKQAAALAKLHAEVDERRAGLPERSLMWLALAPSWTIEQAQVCGFPTDGEPVDTTFERIEHAGQCESSASESGPRRYWMSEATRADLIQRITRD